MILFKVITSSCHCRPHGSGHANMMLSLFDFTYILYGSKHFPSLSQSWLKSPLWCSVNHFKTYLTYLTWQQSFCAQVKFPLNWKTGSVHRRNKVKYYTTVGLFDFNCLSILIKTWCGCGELWSHFSFKLGLVIQVKLARAGCTLKKYNIHPSPSHLPSHPQS